MHTGPPEGGPRPSLPPVNALPAGTRLGEFELVSVLGAGGFGIVYLANDHSLQRQVALKEYMPASLAERSYGLTVSVRSQQDVETFGIGLRSFINEARLLARFDHPSLVKVHRFWEANGTAYMVMPYYSGITLARYLKQCAQPPDEAWLRALLVQLLQALEVLHASQCLHRDIAPDNVLMLPGGRPLLLDFGAARRVIGDRRNELTVIFKPGYAPVEQCGGMDELPQGPWTDLYALASVAYLAITGHKPAPALQRLLADRYEPLARVAAGRYSAGFLEALDHALALLPQDRPQTAAELRRRLEVLLSPLPARPLAPALEPAPAPAPAFTPAPTPAPARAAAAAAAAAPAAAPAPGARRLPWAFGAAALALAAAATTAYWLTRPADGPLPAPQPSVTPPAVPVAPAPVPVPAAPQPEATPRPVAPPAPSAEPPLPPPPPPSAPPDPAPRPAAAPQPAPQVPPAAPSPRPPLPAVPAPVPRPQKPPAPPPDPAPVERPPAPVAVERTPKAAPPARDAAAPRGLSARCADVIQRVMLGEPMTPDEREFLKQECKP